MEHDSFDALIRQFGTLRLTRSRALRGLAAGALGVLAGAALNADRAAARPGRKARGKSHTRAQQADPPADKVTICHFTHSAKNPYEIISVSANSLDAHVKHGDFAVDPDDPNHCCIDSDCGDGETCNTTTGTCEAVCLPDGVLCTASSQCCTGCCFDPAGDMQRVAHCGLQDRPGRCV